MLKRILCCFRTSNVPPDMKITNNEQPQKLITIIDKETYVSSEWLNNLDMKIVWKNTIEFVPPVEKGIVIKVYDGDTITVASKLPYPSSPLYRFSVRLNGIDCPEIKGKDENEKKCAQIAKQEMSDLILNKIVSLKNVQTEKYGRILADVYIGDLHVNKHLIEKRLAISYDGGTKISPTNWMDYYCKGVQ
jgi:endonuclease YncB( thermonuclease family)